MKGETSLSDQNTGFEQLFSGAVVPGKGPEALFKSVYNGAVTALNHAETLLGQAIKEFGAGHPVGYPDTAYCLPVIRCLSGEEIKTLGELSPVLDRVRSSFKKSYTSFANARLMGEAAWYAAEIIESLRYLRHTEEKPLHRPPWTGFLGDPVVRMYGVKLVDRTIPGQAVILGRAKDAGLAKMIVNSLMVKGFMIFLCDEVIEQLLELNVKLGIDYIAFPLGSFTQIIHAANFALRAGMMFGSVPPGDRDAQRDYQHRRVLAFMLYLGKPDMIKDAACMGAINVSFPVITDQPLPEDRQIENWFISQPDYDKIVQTCLEYRGIKITALEIDVPVTVGSSFEGETIRKKDAHVEFGGCRTPSFELVRMVPEEDIEDGKITLLGPDINAVRPGGAMPLGLVVEVYGRKMQEDFEPVLERRVHHFINYGEGLWHVAQRDIMWIRISRDAYKKGFRLRHLGLILYAKLKAEFPSIVDRVQVTIITDEQKLSDARDLARKRYIIRDERLKQLQDENVSVFYSCSLCRSFAPTHICIIAPERVGIMRRGKLA